MNTELFCEKLKKSERLQLPNFYYFLHMLMNWIKKKKMHK